VGQTVHNPSAVATALMCVLDLPLLFGNAKDSDHPFPSKCVIQYSQ